MILALIEPMRLAVIGLVMLPLGGIVFAVLEIISAHRDLWLVRVSPKTTSADERMALHSLWSQMARLTGLVVIAVMATLEIVGTMNGELLVVLIYVLTIVGVADAWRARRLRTKMMADLATEKKAEPRSTEGRYN